MLLYFLDTDNVRTDGSHCRNVLNVVLISGFIVVGIVALIILLIVHPRIKTNPEVSRYLTRPLNNNTP